MVLFRISGDSRLLAEVAEELGGGEVDDHDDGYGVVGEGQAVPLGHC